MIASARVRLSVALKNPSIKTDPGLGRVRRGQDHYSHVAQHKGRRGRSTLHMSTPAQATSSTAGESDPVVQYIVLRRDLWAEQGWPLGPLIAQACHASLAAMWLSKNDPDAQQYVSDDHIDSMHKVVLECKGETQLRNLAAKLSDAGVPHKLWIEQPEDYPTALATKPCRKSTVSDYFKKMKLCKGSLS